jgi:hypothetical protein
MSSLGISTARAASTLYGGEQKVRLDRVGVAFVRRTRKQLLSFDEPAGAMFEDLQEMAMDHGTLRIGYPTADEHWRHLGTPTGCMRLLQSSDCDTRRVQDEIDSRCPREKR